MRNFSDYMADYSYLECSTSQRQTPLYCKPDNSELYESIEREPRRNMGVLVTGPWPMSQPIYERPGETVVAHSLPSYNSRRSIRDSKNYSSDSCQHHHSSSNRQILCSSESFRNTRPFSVPPSLSYGGGRDGNQYQMELMPRRNGNSNSPHQLYNEPEPFIPSRAVLNELHPTAPPTCAPWLKKMKVIKKIQRKIGIG